MKEDFNADGVYIPQNRWVTVLSALFFFVCSGVLIVLPILTFFVPIDGTTEEITAFKVICFLAAIIAGLPLFGMFISMAVRLKYNYVLCADKEGIYIFTEFIPLKFMPWNCIEKMNYNGEKFSGRYSKTLQIYFNGEAGAYMNAWQRFWARRWRGQGYNYGITVNFALCKGRAADNAAAIIDMWQAWKNTAEKQN